MAGKYSWQVVVVNSLRDARLLTQGERGMRGGIQAAGLVLTQPTRKSSTKRILRTSRTLERSNGEG